MALDSAKMTVNIDHHFTGSALTITLSCISFAVVAVSSHEPKPNYSFTGQEAENESGSTGWVSFREQLLGWDTIEGGAFYMSWWEPRVAFQEMGEGPPHQKQKQRHVGASFLRYH